MIDLLAENCLPAPCTLLAGFALDRNSKKSEPKKSRRV